MAGGHKSFLSVVRRLCKYLSKENLHYFRARPSHGRASGVANFGLETAVCLPPDPPTC